MEVACVKGEPVVLRDTRSQVFTGLVKTINTKLGRIVLEDVVQKPGIVISGCRNFDRDEIVELRSANFEEINGEIIESSENEEQAQVTSVKLQSKTLPEPDCKVVNNQQVEYTFIKDLGSDYASAIRELQNAPKIGVIALDASQGRRKRASVIATSTSTHVFIFDLFLTGDDLFAKGLGEILQSTKIEKILHDSRLPSDCLKRKHAVNLENVRDVEAEDIMVVYQDRKTIRRHRRTLEYLIKVYLGVEVGVLDKDKWGERPLKDSSLQELANVISYLIPLHEAVEQKYLKRLIDASRIYSTCVRELGLFDYMFYTHEETLRKEMINIVAPKGDIRGVINPGPDCRQHS